MSTSWIVLGILAALILYVVYIYNGLVALRQRVNQSFADVDVQLKMRHDLIPNLVETVKGYASHERGTLEAVVQARNAAIAARGQGGSEQQAAAENMLTGALAPAFRARRGLSGPQGQHEFPAVADRTRRRREQDRRRAPLLQQRRAGIQHRDRATARRALRGALGFHRREFFDLGETRPQLEQAPSVKF
jgi:LemA protein